jgi:hypothetical protein
MRMQRVRQSGMFFIVIIVTVCFMKVVIVIIRIFIVHLKWWLAIFNTELGNDADTSHCFSMIRQIASVHLLQDRPLLESLVDCLVPAPHKACHSLCCFMSPNGHWSLRMPRRLSSVSIIGFKSLSKSKHCQ